MKAYYIKCTVKGQPYETHIDAKDLDSAKQKIGKKFGYKTGKMVYVNDYSIVGYY